MRKEHLKPLGKKANTSKTTPNLEKPNVKVALETPAALYPAVFSLLGVDLCDPPTPKKMRSRRLPSLSSTSNTSETGGKGAVLKKRAKRRTRKLVKADEYDHGRWGPHTVGEEHDWREEPQGLQGRARRVQVLCPTSVAGCDGCILT